MEEITTTVDRLREVYDRHVKLVYTATKADIDFKSLVERHKAEMDAVAAKARQIVSEAMQAQIDYERAVLQACEDLRVPIGHSIDVFGDGKVKPAGKCVNPDGTLKEAKEA